MVAFDPSGSSPTVYAQWSTHTHTLLEDLLVPLGSAGGGESSEEVPALDPDPAALSSDLQGPAADLESAVEHHPPLPPPREGLLPQLHQEEDEHHQL